MHILLIHQYFQETDDPGGLRWNAMAKLWVEQGHEVTVIAGMTHYTKGIRHPKYRNKYTYVDAFAPGIKVIRTHVSKSYNNNFRGRMNAYFAFAISGIYGGLFKAREKYDCIVVSSPPLTVGLIALTLSLFKRIPYIFEIRDLWPESAIDTGVLKNKFIINQSYKLEKLLYKKALLINVVTPAMRAALITKKGIPASKISYFPNAADFELTDNLLNSFDKAAFRKAHNIPVNHFVACYVGAHGVANHLIQLLQAAKQIKDAPITIILIGDGMRKNELIATAEEWGLSNVLFFDAVPKEQALAFIMAADIGLSILKKADAFKTVYSNKTFDYMACKKAVLLTIDGVSRELVEAADAGYYSPPEEPEALAALLLDLDNKREEIMAKGEQGYQYAKKHFDRITLGNAYIKTIVEAVQQKSSK